MTGASGAAGVGRTVDVLVVDDDEGARTTLVDILVLAGLSASAAGTAGEALAGRDGAIPQLAIVDYRLPDATGLELAARLKDADPDLPVIVLTGNASLETAVAAVGQVDEYLTKPVAPARLLRSVRAGLEQRRLRCENRDLLGRLQHANLTLEARVRDRTEQLHADRERLAEAQRIAHIGSWEWDVEPHVLTWSDELHRIFGVDPAGFEPSYDELYRRPVHDEDRMAGRAWRRPGPAAPFNFVHRVALLRRRDPLAELSRASSRSTAAATWSASRGTAQDITGRRGSRSSSATCSRRRRTASSSSTGRAHRAGQPADGDACSAGAGTSSSASPSRCSSPSASARATRRHAPPPPGHPRRAADHGRRPRPLARRADGTEFPVEISLSPLRTEQGMLVSAAVRDVSERKQAQLQLAHQALHDALTGLPNRVLLADRLEQALARSARTGSEVAVLFIDLDRFKLVNDSRGHAAGDELLVTVADRLRGVVRTDDIVARFGGDEFVVVCEDQRAAFEASLVAERITEVAPGAVLVDGQEIFLTASVGIAVADGDRLARRACCATPTPPCTGPRSRAGPAASSSTPPCGPRPSRVWRPRAPCTGPSSGTSCASTTSRSSTWRRAGVPASRRSCAGTIPEHGLVVPGVVHPPGRGDRAHRPHRRLGPRRGGPGPAQWPAGATRAGAGAHRQREPLRPPAAPARPDPDPWPALPRPARPRARRRCASS